MSCGPSSRSSPSSFLGLLRVLASILLFMVPHLLTPESTSAEQLPNDSRPNEESSLNKVSAELLARLEALLASSETALSESETLRREVAELRTRLEELSSESENWRKACEELLNSLDTLTKEFADYRQASQERHRLDQVAIEQARGELELWKWTTLGTGATALVLLILCATR